MGGLASPTRQPAPSGPHSHLLSGGSRAVLSWGLGSFSGGQTWGLLPPGSEGSSQGLPASRKKCLGSCFPVGLGGGVHWGAWPLTPSHAIPKPEHRSDTAAGPRPGLGLGGPTQHWPNCGFGLFTPRAPLPRWGPWTVGYSPAALAPHAQAGQGWVGVRAGATEMLAREAASWSFGARLGLGPILATLE